MSGLQQDALATLAPLDHTPCRAIQFAQFPPLDAFCTPVVSVFVGPDLKEYRIHYGVLVHSSFWFKREFSEEWSETEYPRVYLRDETNEIFDVAMNWLYARRLENDGGDLSRRHHYSMSLQKMCEVYRFAEKYIIPGLANTVIGYFIGQFASDWAIPTRTIMYAIKNFSSDSLLWKLISTLLEKAFGLRGWDKFAGTCDERWLKDIERWANDSPRPSQGTRSFDKTACRSMNRDEYFYHSILEIPGATVAYKRPYSMTQEIASPRNLESLDSDQPGKDIDMMDMVENQETSESNLKYLLEYLDDQERF